MGAEYRVLKITQLSRMSEDKGGLEPFYKHEIKTKGGTRLIIDISEKDFTPERATPILTKAAIDADKILTS